MLQHRWKLYVIFGGIKMKAKPDLKYFEQYFPIGLQ